VSLRRRLVVCLDVDAGRVVKGTEFVNLKVVGDPVELAIRYAEQGADEIVFLDISASAEGRATTLDVVRATAANLLIPLTVGGGVRSVDDMAETLKAGADKVAVNSGAVARPQILAECAARFGRQCVVASIDALRVGDSWEVITHGGRVRTGLDALEWVRTCVHNGAGEILLTSIDRDGTREGYDLELLRAVSALVTVPVVASGGAGSAAHVVEVLAEGTADAALLAGILHDQTTTVPELKQRLAEAGVTVRGAA
jgi:cyclase